MKTIITVPRTAVAAPMAKQFLYSALLALFSMAGLIGGTLRAEWPGRVFAPYMYIGAGDNFKLTDCNDVCGVKYFTLAFIIARQEGRGRDMKYYKEPSWDGRIPIEQNLYKDQIDAIRARRRCDHVLRRPGGQGTCQRH